MNASGREEFLIHEPQFIKREFIIEVLLLLAIALGYGGRLLNFSENSLQQTGEHNEAFTLPLLVDQALHHDGQFPLWNPYMETGMPHSGDPVSQFFNPLIFLFTLFLPAIPAFKLSILSSFFLAGLGQLLLGYVVGFRLPVRLWSALLFMLSGGLAMLWRLGWASLLIGIAWVPFCLAFVLWALVSKRRMPIVMAAASLAMLFLSGTMYWSLYFAGVAILLILIAITLAWFASRLDNSQEPRRMIARVALILVFAAGFSAVYLLPLSDTVMYMDKRDAPDVQQKGAQPITYAMFDYVVKDFPYYQSEGLGKLPSGSWMYIGVLPFILLILLPLSLQQPQRRDLVVLFLVLTIFLFAWQANPYTPIHWIYKAVPFLYSFRFPNQLLIFATVPLLILAGFGLEYVFSKIEGVDLYIHLFSPSMHEETPKAAASVKVSSLLYVGMVGFLMFSLYDVFKSNQGFGFSEGALNPEAASAISWLKHEDPGSYYVQIGNPDIFWNWLPAAYRNEIMVLNFDDYARNLRSSSHQKDPATPIRATAKYIFAQADHAPQEPALLLHSFKDVNLYLNKDSLPFSFLASNTLLSDATPLDPGNVASADAKFNGPNRISITAETTENNKYLVVLESYYPGWKVYIDNREAELNKIGDFLGVLAKPGRHIYTFVFAPMKFTIGLVLSIMTGIAALLYLGLDQLKRKRAYRQQTEP